jgi:hypothetical protein
MKTRLDLAAFFENKNILGRGVEVGSYKGEYAKDILSKWSGTLYLVDVWKQLDIAEYEDLSNQKNSKEIYSDCISNINNESSRCIMIRASSKNAVYLFNDESLDFVYIDANHKYDFVKKDIALWYPKVRRGGILSGHDYLKIDWQTDKNFAPNGKDKHIWMDSSANIGVFDIYAGLFGVNPAIEEFCVQNNIELQLTTDEWFRSWYLIKT